MNIPSMELEEFNILVDKVTEESLALSPDIFKELYTLIVKANWIGPEGLGLLFIQALKGDISPIITLALQGILIGMEIQRRSTSVAELESIIKL